MLKRKTSSKYHVWYKKFYLKNYVCYCTSNFYENITKNSTKLYRVLICVLYSFIDNHVCIDYLCCKYKTISDISSDKRFEDKSYNEFLGIGIP